MTALPLNFICKPVLRLSRLSVGNLPRYMTMAAVLVLWASAQQPEDLQQQLQQLKQQYEETTQQAIVPDHSPAAVLEEILPDLDQVLMMSVNPGFGHQDFIQSTLPKSARLTNDRADIDGDNSYYISIHSS